MEAAWVYTAGFRALWWHRLGFASRASPKRGLRFLPEPLSEKVREDLVSAVKSVSLEDLPIITASQKIGEGIRGRYS
jgi:hypothetical protein